MTHPSRNRGFTLVELSIVIVLIAIIITLAVPSLLRSRMASHELSACGSLRALVGTQASWRQLDSDSNGKQDYWTVDVAGFYGIQDKSGSPLRSIEITLAKADASRVVSYYAKPAIPQARAGYRFRALLGDAAGSYRVNAIPTQTAVTIIAPGTLACHEFSYAFMAMPDTYNATGIRKFIMNESGVIYGVDGGDNSFIATWPGSDPTAVTLNGRFWAAVQ
ncbi:MAG: DUF2950 family protein [Planctomycetes bacterium]|nr:DUF2950 family protein [Planctomycetota bacterium]